VARQARAITCVFLAFRPPNETTNEEQSELSSDPERPRGIHRAVMDFQSDIPRVLESFISTSREQDSLPRLPLIRARPFTLSDDIYLVSVYQR